MDTTTIKQSLILRHYLQTLLYIITYQNIFSPFFSRNRNSGKGYVQISKFQLFGTQQIVICIYNITPVHCAHIREVVTRPILLIKNQWATYYSHINDPTLKLSPPQNNDHTP